ncbi:MAG: hypothetical protein Q9225_007699, partial [Loekoesia sp. 1 TL-2023]
MIRFLTSFDERAFDKLFNEKKGRIHAIEQRMLRVTTLEFQKGMTEKVNRLETGFRMIFDRQKDSVLGQRDLLLELGANIQKLLEQHTGQPALHLAEREDRFAANSTSEFLSNESSQSTESTRSSSVDSVTRSGNYVSVEMKHSQTSIAIVPSVCHRREAILDILKPLRTKYARHVQALLDMTYRASQLMIDFQVQKRLVSWNKESNSNTLWIQGPYDVSSPSQNTLTAVCMVALSRQSDIPCISHFCNINPPAHSPNSRSSHQGALMDMVKSLVIQMAFLIPATFVTTIDFSSQRLEKLRQDALSIDDALNLLRDLRSLAPPYLHCVIDGAQDLEDRDD